MKYYQMVLKKIAIKYGSLNAINANLGWISADSLSNEIKKF